LLPSLSSPIGGLVVAVDVTTGDLVSGGESGMERRFRVEAKTFFFSTKELRAFVLGAPCEPWCLDARLFYTVMYIVYFTL
jgi:hypothetical protein